MINELFQENPNEVEEIPIQRWSLRLYPHIFSPEEKEAFFNQLKENVKWQPISLQKNHQTTP